MAKSDIAARLATARQRLSKALGTQFQNRITYRQGQVDFVEYDDQGRLVRATMTVDGVANIPVIASAGDALQVGDSIRVVNRGTPANPQYKYDMHDMSSYPAAAVSPAATLPTPTGLALTSTLRIPTSGGQVSTITASWRALADSIMQNGVYEVEIKRNEDVEAHTSRCPHRVGSTALNGSATFNDSSITVDSTASFPSTGRILIADAEISYTGKTTTTFTGLTWYSGSGTYADSTEVTGLTVAFTFDHVEPGRQYNVRVRAVSVTGAVSEWTSTSSITTTGNQQLQIQDNFDQYGGLLTSPLESLWFLQILHMDSLDEFFNHSYASIDTAHNVEGSGALHFSGTAPGGNAYAYCNMDLSVENRFTDADYLMVYIYVESLSDTGKAITRFAFAVDSGNYYLYEVTLTSTGAHYVKMKKSDFSVSGSPDWANITMFWVWQVTDGTTFPVVDIDDIRLVKADEADGTVYNDTGTTWDFVPQQGNGSEWHIYPGNRPGEPSKPFSLGQIKKAASPSTWYLGYHTLADAYYATAVVGGYLKGTDGQIALAFCIQDSALATRTLYAVEADSANDKVRLVRWVNGSRTQIAQTDFVFAPDQVIWLGADWRDFDGEDRIKVYASLTEGNVIQAANLVISTTDANVARGGPVGVMTKEAPARYVDFRAGSPQHAMTAEVAFYANVAGASIEDYGAAVARQIALPGAIGVWPMSSVQRSTGDVYDVSGQGRKLSYQGSPTFNFMNNGVPYVDLDGVGDYLVRTDETDLRVLGTESIYDVPGLTFGGWFRPDQNTGSEMTLLSKFLSTSNQRSYMLHINPTNDIVILRISSDGTAGGTTAWAHSDYGAITYGRWFFVVGRFIANSAADIFINGVWDKNSASIASIFSSSADFCIGAIADPARYFDGQVSLCFLRANALTDEIIERTFQQERALFGVM